MTAPQPVVATLEPPPGGCEVAQSCALRVSVDPPFRLGAAPPVVRRHSSLEMLGVIAGPDAGGWTARAIAFAPGELPLPVLAVEIVDEHGARTLVETSARTVTVATRALPSGATLAGLERLAVTATPQWWGAVLLASLVLGTAALLVSTSARRVTAALDELLAPMRVRRAATRRLRLAARQAGALQAYDAIVAALRLVLGYRGGRPVDALTAAELVAVVSHADLAVAERERLTGLLVRSDAVRFGGHRPSVPEVGADLGLARALVRSRRLVRRPRRRQP